MLNLPKKYLSYSQMRLWLDDKEKYRSRYYRDREEFQTKALMFGSEIAKALENGTVALPDLVQYPVREFRIKEEVEGVPFFAYLDTYDPSRLKFREYKTGQRTPNGGDRWNQALVDGHLQLDVYSTLVQLKEGGVDDECHLDWLEVRKKVKTMEFNGETLTSESNELELTGRVESFARVITQTERERTKILIRTVASEISADFTAFLRERGALSADFIN